MKRMFLWTMGLAMALGFALPSLAQKLMPRQRGLELVVGAPIIKGEKLWSQKNFGVGVSLTRYLQRENYTFLAAEYEQQMLPYRSYDVPLKDMLLQVGYMTPIITDRGKNVLCYMGMSALGGYEELNHDKQLLPPSP